MKFYDTIEVNKMAEKWEIWDEKEEAAKSKEETKKLYLKGSTSGSMSLKRKQVRRCQWKRYGIM